MFLYEKLLHTKIIIIYLFVFIAFGRVADASDTVLLVLGDSRPGTFNEQFMLTAAIIEDAVQFTVERHKHISAVIMTGDYVSTGNSVTDWEEWRAANAAAFNYRVYPCIGNHDDGPDPYCILDRCYPNYNYYQTFHKPEWYSADINNIHLISLSSNLDDQECTGLDRQGQEPLQKNWLKNDLGENQNRWTVAIWHEPAYGSHTFFGKSHGSNMSFRHCYVPVLEQYGCDLVLCGHNHWYERTVPVLDDEENSSGIVHITTGGGGAPLLPVSFLPFDKVRSVDGNVLSEVNVSRYHFCIITAEEDVLRIQAVQFYTHKILDDFEVYNRQDNTSNIFFR